MKLPQTFLPSKSLEEKIKQLLENPPNIHNDKSEEHRLLYEELKKEFPKFIDYLFDLYPRLALVKNPELGTAITKNEEKSGWAFYESLPTWPHTRCVAVIHSYEKKARNTIEYGYKSQVLIKGKWYNLEYRKGYRFLTLPSTLAKAKIPLRIDEHKKIPFP